MAPEDPSMEFVNPGKFFKPPVGYDLIARPSLFSKLREGSKIPLTLVSAPSGFGKSSLVSSWLDSQEMGYAWLSLEDAENSLPVFLRSLIRSVRQGYPDFANSLEKLLNTPNKLPNEQLVIQFNRALSEIPKDILIVLDDFHVVREGEIHKFLYEAFKFPLQHIHLILLTRHDPPLPLLYFRSKGWLLEIRSRDLSFSRKELGLFFRKRNQQDLEKEQLDLILEVTEGWPTGVRLLSTGLKESPGHIQLDYGEYAYNYFHELIDQNLLCEPTLREFCMWMSAFEEFNPDFADEILSSFSDTEVASEKVILDLVLDNLFIIPMDEREYVYRFHHLIREYIYTQLIKTVGAETVQRLHVNGGDWLYQHGYLEKALKQYILGEEYDRAIFLYRELRKTYMSQTNWASLEVNLELFPPDLRGSLPELRLTQAWSCTYAGEIFEMFRIVEDLRSQLWEQPSTDPVLVAEWAVLEAYRQYNLVQDYQSCLELCEYALVHLPANHSYALGFAWIFLAGSLQVIEGTSAAVDRIHKGLQYTSDSLVISHQLMVLNYIYWIDGNIPMLQKSACRLLELGEHSGNLEARANGFYFLGIGAYTTGNLTEAERILTDFFELRYHTIAIIHFMGAAALSLCRAHAGDEILESREFKILESFVQQQRHPFYNMFFEALKTELIWRSGNFRRARERVGEIDAIHLTPLSNFYCPQLTQIKVLLAGNSKEDLNKAEEQISAIQRLLEETNNKRFQIDVHLLTSQLYANKGNRDFEEKHREAALKRASVFQVVSPFLEMEDKVYLRLEATCRGEFPGLYKKLNLLRPFGNSKAPELSPREKQVWQLLTRHLSNKEIGSRLNISEKTVKRHTGSLFKKLGVNSRVEAAELVSEFNIS